jgi:Leucine-rich repeat (LRR) protein
MLRQLCLLLLFSNFALIAKAQAIKWQDALQLDPKTVTSLDCSGLKWDTLPVKFFEFVALQSLDLSKNKLTFLPDQMKVFTQLQDLKLGKNKLDHFPLVLCQLPLLRDLSLERNALRMLPDQISALSQLQYLDLYGNAIEHFGEGVFLLPNLRLLNIEGVMYGTVFAKQLLGRLPNTKVLIDPPCKCLD